MGKEKGVLEVSINNLKEMQIEAEVVPLDDFILENKISQCDLVKIDTDGNDYNVLLGAEKSINQFRPIIVIETNGLQEILNFLTSKSYELFDVQLVPRSEWDVLPKNLICIPR